MKNETPWTEVQGFFRATRLRRIAYASLRAPFIPRFKSLGFSGRFYKASAEQRQHLQDRDWGKYAILIWKGAILFFLIDLLFGSLIAMILYIVMTAILWLGQPWTIIPSQYAGKTMALFCLIYLILNVA